MERKGEDEGGRKGDRVMEKTVKNSVVCGCLCRTSRECLEWVSLVLRAMHFVVRRRSRLRLQGELA